MSRSQPYYAFSIKGNSSVYPFQAYLDRLVIMIWKIKFPGSVTRFLDQQVVNRVFQFEVKAAAVPGKHKFPGFLKYQVSTAYPVSFGIHHISFQVKYLGI